MIPSFETQLQVSVRALGEIIAPALAGAHKHVNEQLHLVMAALGFMRARLSSAASFQRAELEGYIALAAEAAANFRQDRSGDCEPLVEAVLAARSALLSPTAEADFLQQSTRCLRELVAGLIGQSATDGEAAALQTLVLARSGEMLCDARLWCLPLGFELNSDALSHRDWLKTEYAIPSSLVLQSREKHVWCGGVHLSRAFYDAQNATGVREAAFGGASSVFISELKIVPGNCRVASA